MLSREMAVLAFYGFKSNAKAMEVIYETILERFTALGYPPTRLGVGAPRFGKKMVGFPRTNAKLIRHGFQNVKSFEFKSLVPGQEGFIKYTIWQASLNFEYSYCDIITSIPVLALDERMLDLARTILHELKPVYGTGFYRPRRLGPNYYVIGMNYEDPEEGDRPLDDEEKLRVSRWSDCNLEEGYLRDIYPWNFLTAPHLARKVGRQKLANWIGADPRRGELSEFVNGVYFWRIEPSALAEIRKTLWEAEVIFNWRWHTEYRFIALAKQELLQATKAGQSVDQLLAIMRRHLQKGVLKEDGFYPVLAQVQEENKDTLSLDDWTKLDYVRNRFFGQEPPHGPSRPGQEPLRMNEDEIGAVLEGQPPIPGTPVFEIDETTGTITEHSSEKIAKLLKKRRRKAKRKNLKRP